MGQKVHPIGMRVGIIRDWDAKWYAEKEYADYLHEDLAIRKFIQKELADASVSTIEIERAVNKVIVSLHTAKPGMVIYYTNKTMFVDPKDYESLKIQKL